MSLNNMTNRRVFIKKLNMGLAAAAGSFYTSNVFSNILEQQPTLREAARKIGLKYGAHIDNVDLRNAPVAYTNLVLEQCSLYAGNWNWKLAFPSQNTTVPSWEDPNISFAKAHHLPLTGGHLLWSNKNDVPVWFATTDDPEKAISDHIKIYASLYGANTYSWNVVNEAINPPDQQAYGLRKNIFLDKMGPSYFDFAYHKAKETAPHILRVYNDYDMEMDNKYQESRRTALLKLLDKFKKDNTPVDAIGLQSHLKLDGAKFSDNVYRNFLHEISSRGFKIMITELDVFDKITSAADNETRDQQVADLYQDFLTTALDERAVIELVNWGLCDRDTWISPKFDPSFARSDGKPSRPLPFDENLKPTHAYYAMLHALANAPKR